MKTKNFCRCEQMFHYQIQKNSINIIKDCNKNPYFIIKIRYKMGINEISIALRILSNQKKPALLAS